MRTSTRDVNLLLQLARQFSSRRQASLIRSGCQHFHPMFGGYSSVLAFCGRQEGAAHRQKKTRLDAEVADKLASLNRNRERFLSD